MLIKGNEFTGKEIDIVVNGDSLELLKKIPDNYIDLVLTDPPFNIAVDDKAVETVRKWRGSKINTMIKAEWDKFTDEDFYKFNELWMTECYRVLKPKHYLCVWNSYKNIPDIVNLGKQLGLRFQRLFIWHKRNPGISFPLDFVPSCEYCIIFYKESDDKNYTKYFNGKMIVHDFYESPIVSNKERKECNHHPSIKPKELMRIFIKKLTQKGDIVLDAFAGSGSTLVVAKQEERKFIGMEMNKDYCETITKRLNTCTSSKLTFF